jgi:uncharacterized membrane protein
VSTMPGFERLVNFSDAVVAIAATLLVLPLVDLASKLGDRRVADLLHDNGYQLLGFALSFFVIARFWVAHNAMFGVLRGFSPALVRANLVWLVSIAFLPFPTELVSRSGTSERLTCALYIGTMTLTAASAAVIQWIAIHAPDLQTEEARGTLRLYESTATAVALAVALAVSVAVPAIGLKALLLLFVVAPLGRLPRLRR